LIHRKPTLYNDGTTATTLRHAICCAMCNASSRPHRYSAKEIFTPSQQRLYQLRISNPSFLLLHHDSGTTLYGAHLDEDWEIKGWKQIISQILAEAFAMVGVFRRSIENSRVTCSHMGPKKLRSQVLTDLSVITSRCEQRSQVVKLAIYDCRARGILCARYVLNKKP
jgi:hypothetical protein